MPDKTEPWTRARLIIALIAFAVTLWIVPTLFAFTIARSLDGNVTIFLAIAIGDLAATWVLMRLLRRGIFRR